MLVIRIQLIEFNIVLINTTNYNNPINKCQKNIQLINVQKNKLK